MTLPPPSPRQTRVIWFGITSLAIAVSLALLASVIWGVGRALHLLSPVLWPLAVAGITAYLLDAVVDCFERRGMGRPRAIVAVFAIAFLLVLGFFAVVVPPVVHETRQLAERIPLYVKKTEARFQDWLNNPPPWARRFLEKENLTAAPDSSSTPVTNELPQTVASSTNEVSVTSSTNNPSLLSGPLNQKTIRTATGWLANTLPEVGSWLFGQVGRVASWFGVLAGLALIPVYAFYFLLEKRRISSRWADYLPVSDSSFKNELVFILNSVNNYLIAFFRGQVLVAICDGILYSIGFLSIGLPYAALIGMMAIVLTMIPFLGAIVTCATALVIAVVQFGDWLHPLLVLMVFGIVQSLEGLFISPRIMGGRVGLHPLTIIIAVMTGTTLLGGLLGGILAIPLTAALRVLMFRYVWKARPEAPPVSS